jgi:hypothetical protein
MRAKQAKMDKFEKNKRLDSKYKQSEIERENQIKADRQQKVQSLKREDLVRGVQEYRRYLEEVENRKEIHKKQEELRNAAELKRKMERI